MHLVKEFEVNTVNGLHFPAAHILEDHESGIISVEHPCSPILIESPHNGARLWARHLINGAPLGITNDHGSFLDLHEAWDIGIDRVVKAVHAKLPGANLLTADGSRLIVDMNRQWDYAIETGRFTERRNDNHLYIPGNAELDSDEVEWRRQLYTSYHSTHDRMINNIKEKGNKPLVIQFHSAAPSFNGVPRDGFQIGILYREKTPVVEKLISYLREHSTFNIAENWPYDPSSQDFAARNKSDDLARAIGEHFPIVEINQALLLSANKEYQEHNIEALSTLFADAYRHLVRHFALRQARQPDVLRWLQAAFLSP